MHVSFLPLIFAIFLMCACAHHIQYRRRSRVEKKDFYARTNVVVSLDYFYAKALVFNTRHYSLLSLRFHNHAALCEVNEQQQRTFNLYKITSFGAIISFIWNAYKCIITKQFLSPISSSFIGAQLSHCILHFTFFHFSPRHRYAYWKEIYTQEKEKWSGSR